MGDLESVPRDEMLELLGFVPPPQQQEKKPKQKKKEPKRNQPQSAKREKKLKPKKEPVYRGRPLPDLSTVPPARGNPMLNQAGVAAARKAYEEQQAARAERVREPKATPGRAVPRRPTDALQAILETRIGREL